MCPSPSIFFLPQLPTTWSRTWLYRGRSNSGKWNLLEPVIIRTTLALGLYAVHYFDFAYRIYSIKRHPRNNAACKHPCVVSSSDSDPPPPPPPPPERIRNRKASGLAKSQTGMSRVGARSACERRRPKKLLSGSHVARRVFFAVFFYETGGTLVASRSCTHGPSTNSVPQIWTS